jgi:aspartokinase
MPQEKRKLTQAEAGMAKSLSKLNTPLTAKEKQQTVVQRAKLLQENQRLNPNKKITIVGQDMTKVPSVAKRMMEKKAAAIKSRREMNQPTSTKRVVGVFSIKNK